jgi:hypothetical protein
VAGCSTSSIKPAASPSTDASAATSSKNSSQNTDLKPWVQPLPKLIHQVGEAVSIKDQDIDLQITVNGTREHQGKRVLKPNDGNKWVLVDTKIVNKGTKPATISVMSFEVFDGANNPHDVALLASALEDVKSPTGEINPGEERRGEVPFELPIKSQGLKLVFNPNMNECKAPDAKKKLSTMLNCEPIVVKLP